MHADAARRVKAAGRKVGFSLVRIASASPFLSEREHYLTWIADGRAAEMRWITPERAVLSTEPSTLVPDVRSIIAVGLPYREGPRPGPSPSRGRVARYAWGRDYHRVMGGMLRDLATTLTAEFGGAHRCFVDTGPVLDRAAAARAGLGWIGKNTNLLTTSFGSYVLLGEILTTLDLPPDPPLVAGCGSCRLCLVACPTGALGPEYSLDSRKCISYLTIEHRGPIPRDLRPLMDDWVFGCDICQDVCPASAEPYLSSTGDRQRWVQEARATLRRESRPGGAVPEPAPGHPLLNAHLRPDLDLLWMLRLAHEEYVQVFRGTSLRRAKVWMLRRNAAVALGNVGDREAVTPLIHALRYDEHPIVRGHAAWALSRLNRRLSLEVVAPLRAARETERHADVLNEIDLALAEIGSGTRSR